MPRWSPRWPKLTGLATLLKRIRWDVASPRHHPSDFGWWHQASGPEEAVRLGMVSQFLRTAGVLTYDYWGAA
jgi:hypothetical protein